MKKLCLALVVVCLAFGAGQPVWSADEPKAETGLSGMFRGWYHYPEGSGRLSVRFQAVIIQDGATLVGFTNEPNTFADERREPFLHGVLKGSIEKESRKVGFTKTYDGTAGQEHGVEYSGEASEDGKKLEGTWIIGEYGGRFTLERVANTRSGPLAGVWVGTYNWPEADKKDPVKFDMVVVHHGTRIVGFCKEPNMAGKDEPFLHARLTGRLDEKSGKLTFVKVYDGTAGEDGDYEYSGQLSKDGKKIEGTRTVPEAGSGKFTLDKLRLDETALEGLK
jgi:hypothetical protein